MVAICSAVSDPDALDALALRARVGDAAAADALVEAVAGELRLFVAARCHALDLAEEVVQTALVAGFEALPRYRPEGTLLPWLKGIAKHLLARELRAQARFRRVEGDELAGLLIDAQAEQPVDDDPAVDLTRLEECLRQLSPRARALLERHHRDDVPLARLAQQFKQTTLAIASALKRIRQQVRSCMVEA